MHTRAMALFKEQQCTSVLDYTPIAKAITNLSMDERSKARTKRLLLGVTDFMQDYASSQNTTCPDKIMFVQKYCLDNLKKLFRALQYYNAYYGMGD